MIRSAILMATVAFVPIFGYTGILGKYPNLYLNEPTLLWVPNYAERIPFDNLNNVHRSPESDPEYDFIIVGSGSAGSVIASRLSEIPTWSILLLEAGSPENDLAEAPITGPFLQFSDYNWNYTTEPQKDVCLAMAQQRCAWPRGKALGGTSVINYMIYTRGNRFDYDRWAAMGNPGWSYQDVLPYFLKSEDSHLKKSFNPRYHNRGGRLSVENAFASKLARAFIEAGQELGYNSTDYNSPQQLGFSQMQATIKLGRRHSVAKAFLQPILHRQNLRIVTGAKVIKILIDPFTKKVDGVLYHTHDGIHRINARKEVIISAGAFSSPQLLMLSGVGPKAHLEELGIAPLISNLPVGETLYDHIAFVGLTLNSNHTPANVFDPEVLAKWYLKGEGPLSIIPQHEAVAFIKTTNSSIDKEQYPDVELVIWDSLAGDNGTIYKNILRISDEYYNKMFKSLEATPTFSIIPILLHPKSAGSMKLSSSNPHQAPLFYGNYLTDSEDSDAKTLIAAVRFVQKLSVAGAFKKYNVEVNKKPVVGCEGLVYDSDEYWRCALRFLTTSIHHQVSTCKMGPVADKTAVVDHELKVHGIGNLRVADTSVIPLPLSAHTNAPAIMVGEKASDLIKKDWGAL